METKSDKVKQLIEIIKLECKQREFTVEELQDLVMSLQACVDFRRIELARELF